MGGGESGTSDAYQSQSLNVGKNWMYSIKKKFFRDITRYINCYFWFIRQEGWVCLRRSSSLMLFIQGLSQYQPQAQYGSRNLACHLQPGRKEKYIHSGALFQILTPVCSGRCKTILAGTNPSWCVGHIPNSNRIMQISQKGDYRWNCMCLPSQNKEDFPKICRLTMIIFHKVTEWHQGNQFTAFS